VIEAFADAVTALDDSVPTGTYVDMCSRLPVVDPEKITVPTLIMRGQWDGIASIEDLLKFFAKLPNPDKQFSVMAGISHASFQQKNYMLVYHILASFFAQRRDRLNPWPRNRRERSARLRRYRAHTRPAARCAPCAIPVSPPPRDRCCARPPSCIARV
jgi:predicted dienelactone hydrolase